MKMDENGEPPLFRVCWIGYEHMKQLFELEADIN